MTSQTPINIYQYDDFRVYLRDRFAAQRAADPACTHRAFAKSAGISNPGFLNDVIKGRRTLSAAATDKVIKGFGLSPVEAEYFRLLVEYGQCKNETKRDTLYRQICSRRNRSSFTKLNPALSKYYQDYRYPLIRNAIMAFDFRGNYEELGRFVRPCMPSAEVRKCVRELCEWGLVSQRPDGRYVVTGEYVEPSPTLNEQIRRLNRDWIDQAMDALMTLPPQKRHVSSRLLSVSPAVAKKIGEKIERFRDEIWEMVQDDPEDPSCIMQLNIQYFPRSRGREKA
ncbi:MAG: TIGR02147 family protein [Chitinivibrionales bacterium]|nr:TIGR02147 family protein [Chitinivibrionales bacterium]MBD3396361.1 TIGR02147 family protein [Chitinivibrionales bacterium]